MTRGLGGRVDIPDWDRRGGMGKGCLARGFGDVVVRGGEKMD